MWWWIALAQAEASSTPTAQKTVETSPARNAKDDEVVNAKKKKAELAAAKKAAEEEARKKAQDEADKKVRLFHPLPTASSHSGRRAALDTS